MNFIIRKMLAHDVERLPAPMYRTAVAEHSGDFEELIKTDAATLEASEKCPCHKSVSKVCRLNCGHYAYSKYRQVKCGSNCEISIQEDGQNFFCIFCGRAKVSKNWHVGGILRRWHDVLLPEPIEPDFEMGKFKDAEINRQVEPAFLDPHGYILLPRIHCVIAMVRAYEICAEAELKDHIRWVLGSIMLNDTDVAMVAVEYFEHFLALHFNSSSRTCVS
jgi:hypothetical protein